MIRPAIFILFVWLAALFFASSAFSQSQAAPNAHWHIGSFTGTVNEGTETMSIALVCPSGTKCEYTIKVRPQKPGYDMTERAENVEVLSIEIPNNSLMHTRRAVSSDPSLYSNGRDSPLLLALRPLLESKKSFTRCVGVSELNGAWGMLCEIDSESVNLPNAALLLANMSSSCDHQPFCSRFIFPLWRVN